MLKDSQLIPLTSNHPSPPRPLLPHPSFSPHTRWAEAAMLISPGRE